VDAIETMRRDVERRMRRGERFADVEDMVNASDLPDDEKAALWLLAWSYLHPRAQRREAIAHLERLSAVRPPPAIDRRRHLRAIG
jgi:alkylhydroperoxidase family enzyme